MAQVVQSKGWVGPLVTMVIGVILLLNGVPALIQWLPWIAQTALVMGMPGERVPNTLQARIATREIAAHELSQAGYCPNGFTGPEELRFPHGDRSRTAFVVRCLPQ